MYMVKSKIYKLVLIMAVVASCIGLAVSASSNSGTYLTLSVEDNEESSSSTDITISYDGLDENSTYYLFLAVTDSDEQTVTIVEEDGDYYVAKSSGGELNFSRSESITEASSGSASWTFTTSTLENNGYYIMAGIFLIDEDDPTSSELIDSVFVQFALNRDAIIATAEDLIEEYETLDSSNYTTDSWSAYKSVITNLKEVLSDADIFTTAAIQSAVEWVEEARDSLVVFSATDDTEDDDEEETTVSDDDEDESVLAVSFADSVTGCEIGVPGDDASVDIEVEYSGLEEGDYVLEFLLFDYYDTEIALETVTLPVDSDGSGILEKTISFSSDWATEYYNRTVYLTVTLYSDDEEITSVTSDDSVMYVLFTSAAVSVSDTLYAYLNKNLNMYCYFYGLSSTCENYSFVYTLYDENNNVLETITATGDDLNFLSTMPVDADGNIITVFTEELLASGEFDYVARTGGKSYMAIDFSALTADYYGQTVYGTVDVYYQEFLLGSKTSSSYYVISPYMTAAYQNNDEDEDKIDVIVSYYDLEESDDIQYLFSLAVSTSGEDQVAYFDFELDENDDIILTTGTVYKFKETVSRADLEDVAYSAVEVVQNSESGTLTFTLDKDVVLDEYLVIGLQEYNDNTKEQGNYLNVIIIPYTGVTADIEETETEAETETETDAETETEAEVETETEAETETETDAETETEEEVETEAETETEAEVETETVTEAETLSETGDETSLLSWAIMFVCSAFLISVISINYKKRKQ